MSVRLARALLCSVVLVVQVGCSSNAAPPPPVPLPAPFLGEAGKLAEPEPIAAHSKRNGGPPSPVPHTTEGVSPSSAQVSFRAPAGAGARQRAPPGSSTRRHRLLRRRREDRGRRRWRRRGPVLHPAEGQRLWRRRKTERNRQLQVGRVLGAGCSPSEMERRARRRQRDFSLERCLRGLNHYRSRGSWFATALPEAQTRLLLRELFEAELSAPGRARVTRRRGSPP